MESKNLQKPMAIAMFGGVVVSFAPILYSISDTNPLTGAFFRMLYALPFLFLLMWFSKVTDSRSLNTRFIAVIAGFAFALDFLAYHSTVDWIGTGIGTLIGNSQVIIVTLMSWWLFGERPNLSILVSLPVVMIGLLLISGVLDEDPYGEHPIRGVIAGIFTAIFYSLFLHLSYYMDLLVNYILFIICYLFYIYYLLHLIYYMLYIIYYILSIIYSIGDILYII